MATRRTEPVPDYESLLEFLYLTPVGLIKFRPNGVVWMVNPEAARLLMPLAREAEMSDIYRLFGDLAPDLKDVVNAFPGDSGAICEQRRLSARGTGTTLALSVHKIDPGRLMAVVQDITRVAEQEALLRQDEYRLHAIFENIRDHAICTVGLDGRVEGWNRSLHRTGGWSPADVEGATVSLFFPPTPIGPDAGPALLARARAAGSAEFEGWHVRKDGSRLWGNTVASVLPDGDGHPSGFVLITRDVTERKAREDRLETLATTDPLTGADNRRAGQARLKEVFGLWRRRQRVFAVLMLDCDHFKKVNDRWGHDAGDTVLIAIVGLCRAALRDTDQIVRWGGEEFLLLLRETSLAAGLAAAERLRRAIERAVIARNEETIPITVSIGVAVPQPEDRGADDVVGRADQALYRAKQLGRNRVCDALAGTGPDIRPSIGVSLKVGLSAEVPMLD